METFYVIEKQLEFGRRNNEYRIPIAKKEPRNPSTRFFREKKQPCCAPCC